MTWYLGTTATEIDGAIATPPLGVLEDATKFQLEIYTKNPNGYQDGIFYVLLFEGAGYQGGGNYSNCWAFTDNVPVAEDLGDNRYRYQVSVESNRGLHPGTFQAGEQLKFYIIARNHPVNPVYLERLTVVKES